MRKFTWATALAVCTATACSDPIGPCDRAPACEVSGVDLAVTEARIVDGTRIGADPVTGLDIYAAAPVTVEFTIVNRGDSASAPQPVDGTDDVVPSLAPGEQARVRIIHDFSGQLAVHPSWSTSGFDAREADVRTITASLPQSFGPDDPAPGLPPADEVFENNELDSPRFHVAMPVLTATLSEIDEIREGVPFVTSFTVRNVSVHDADAGPLDVVLCVWDVDLGCHAGWWNYFGRFEVPGVDAGGATRTATQRNWLPLPWHGQRKRTPTTSCSASFHATTRACSSLSPPTASPPAVTRSYDPTTPRASRHSCNWACR